MPNGDPERRIFLSTLTRVMESFFLAHHYFQLFICFFQNKIPDVPEYAMMQFYMVTLLDVLGKACLTQNTVGHTIPIRYTRLYTDRLVRVLSSNRAWGCVGTIYVRTEHGYTGSSKVCHGLNTICKTIFIRLLHGSKYGPVRSVTA